MVHIHGMFGQRGRERERERERETERQRDRETGRGGYVLSYACIHQCRRVCLEWRVNITRGASFIEDVPLVEFMYLVFTRKPGGVTIGDSGLSCCVPCLSSAIISLCLLSGG